MKVFQEIVDFTQQPSTLPPNQDYEYNAEKKLKPLNVVSGYQSPLGGRLPNLPLGRYRLIELTELLTAVVYTKWCCSDFRIMISKQK